MIALPLPPRHKSFPNLSPPPPPTPIRVPKPIPMPTTHHCMKPHFHTLLLSLTATHLLEFTVLVVD